MADKHTYRNREVAISTTVKNSNIVGDATAVPPTTAGSIAAGLEYVVVGGVGSVGAYGYDTNMVSYNELNEPISTQQKGVTNGGTPAIECARDDADEGQIAMRAAGDPLVTDSYVIRVTNQDGSVDYLRGPVSGPNNQGGRSEDFDLDQYTVAVNQIIHVEAV